MFRAIRGGLRRERGVPVSNGLCRSRHRDLVRCVPGKIRREDLGDKEPGHPPKEGAGPCPGCGDASELRPKSRAIRVSHHRRDARDESAQMPLCEEADEETIEVPAANVLVDVERHGAMLELLDEMPQKELACGRMETIECARFVGESREGRRERLEALRVGEIPPE